VGEPVAIIVAEDRHRAEARVDEIAVEQEPLPVVGTRASTEMGATSSTNLKTMLYSALAEQGNIDQVADAPTG
jgi:CO/xanthine dehydrogenase Mo-binding subunit